MLGIVWVHLKYSWSKNSWLWQDLSDGPMRCWDAQQWAGLKPQGQAKYRHQHTSTSHGIWVYDSCMCICIYIYTYICIHMYMSTEVPNQNLQPRFSCFSCPNHPLPSAPTPWQGLGFCPNLYPHSTAKRQEFSNPPSEIISQVSLRYEKTIPKLLNDNP